MLPLRQVLANGEGNSEGTQARTEALDGDNLHRITVGNLASAVVLQTPTYGGAKHEQGSTREGQRLAETAVIERKQDASHSD